MSIADTARELSLYMQNGGGMYQKVQDIIKNLDKKVREGKYDSALAPKLWMYLVDFGAERYTKEYGDVAGMTGAKPRESTAIKRLARQQFPTEARKIVAKEWAEDYEANLGERGLHIHKERRLCNVCRKHENESLEQVGERVIAHTKRALPFKKGDRIVDTKNGEKGVITRKLHKGRDGRQWFEVRYADGSHIDLTDERLSHD